MARLNSSFSRSTETPMDFEYDKGYGPTSTDSPFLQNTSSDTRPLTGQKRSSSQLESPTKPSFPTLRNPEGQAHLFATPSVKPSVPFRSSSFTTPQRSIEYDFSSGPEQSSPTYADSEDTPEPAPRHGPSKSLVNFEGSKTEKKATSSLFSKALSGRGEIAKRAPYTDVMHRRVQKRRRRDADKDVRGAPRRLSNDSDSEERPSSSEGPSQKNKAEASSMGLMATTRAILTFIDAHPTLPNTLSFYVQFLLNCFLTGVLMILIYAGFSMVRNDINERAIVESSEILAEMAVCAREFKENKCDRDSRVPAMEAVCNNWEKCMARDPYKVGRSRLSAGMFAEIFNSFIEPISIKAISVSLATIFLFFFVSNFSFGFWRSKHPVPQPQPPPPPPPPSMYPSSYAYPPPPHQQQQQMGFPPLSSGNNELYYTPYHQNQMGVLQGPPQQGKYRVEEEGSPTKRIGFR